MAKRRTGTAIEVYRGIKFYECADGYFRAHIKQKLLGVDSLHREKWKDAHGPVPPGHDVHHDDHDRANNALGNLVLRESAAHRRHHGRRNAADGKLKRWMEASREGARKWHGSAAGLKFHSKLAKENWAKLKPERRTCVVCGDAFWDRSMHKLATMCSDKCRARKFRQDHPGYYSALRARGRLQPARQRKA